MIKNKTELLAGALNKMKYVPLLLVTAAICLGVTACGSSEESDNQVYTPANVSGEETVTPAVDPDTLEQEFGDFHTPLQAAYLLSPYDEIAAYAKGTQELSRPQAVTLEWDAVDGAQKYYVQLALQEDFSNAVTYETSRTSYDLYNLYLATDYYWRVADSVAELENAYVGSFSTTSYGPRNLYIDGITNARDLGGWLTESGVRVKQGMLYRGGRLNTSDAAEFNLELTEDGIDVLLNQLNVKTELDLRQADNNEVGSVDGNVVEGVDYLNVPLIPPPTANPTNIIDNNPEEVKQIFSILADESNYPIYFHCNIGTDRTGFVAFMINALLGVAEEDLYRDYLFSNFGVVRGPRTLNDFKALYADEINKLEGDTFADRTAKYLTDLGVITYEQIESIRNIML